MAKYEIRVKYSAIRTWEIEANSQKEAEYQARAKAYQYHAPLGRITQIDRADRLRTLSVREVKEEK